MAGEGSLETTSNENISDAAKLNARVFKKLEKALASDPEVDLLSLLPQTYSTRLAERKKTVPDNNGVLTPEKLQTQDDRISFTPPDDLRRFLSGNSIASIDGLSDSVVELVDRELALTNTSGAIETGQRFYRALIALIQNAEVVGSNPVPSTRLIVKFGPDIVAKLGWETEDFTEYTTLQYLRKHKPSIPVPEPLGLLRIDRVSILFSSFLPGPTLEAVWADLTADQKGLVRDQLDTIIRDLRTLQLPPGMPFGGVAGEGCKDARRHLRRSVAPIFNIGDFQTFQFSNPNYGSTMFIDFLRAFTPRGPHQVVFTHGDIRPENIIVEVTGDNRCTIVGIIDWEDSGFYPEYYEATKITNCLATNQEGDWFRFLPPCVSPHSYPVEWLLDYTWGRHIE